MAVVLESGGLLVIVQNIKASTVNNSPLHSAAQHLSLSISLFLLLLLLPSHLLIKLIYQFSKVIVKPARVTPIEHFLSPLLASQ